MSGIQTAGMTADEATAIFDQLRADLRDGRTPDAARVNVILAAGEALSVAWRHARADHVGDMRQMRPVLVECRERLNGVGEWDQATFAEAQPGLRELQGRVIAALGWTYAYTEPTPAEVPQP